MATTPQHQEPTQRQEASSTSLHQTSTATPINPDINMGRVGSRVSHHCPGALRPIGGVPAGCNRDKKLNYCKNHQILCKKHPGMFHLITDPGCGKCIAEVQAADRKARAAKNAIKEAKENDDGKKGKKK